MPDAFTLTLPVPPSANEYHRPVPYRTKGGVLRARMVRTKKADEYIELVRWLCREQRAVLIPAQQVATDLTIYRASRRLDPWNVPKILFDALQGICWENDRQCTLGALNGLDEIIDKGNPHVVLVYHALRSDEQ